MPSLKIFKSLLERRDLLDNPAKDVCLPRINAVGGAINFRNQTSVTVSHITPSIHANSEALFQTRLSCFEKAKV